MLKRPDTVMQRQRRDLCTSGSQGRAVPRSPSSRNPYIVSTDTCTITLLGTMCQYDERCRDLATMHPNCREVHPSVRRASAGSRALPTWHPQ